MMIVNPQFNRDTIPELLHRRAKASPGDIAYSYPESGKACTWMELWRDVRQLARAFLQLGVEKGDRIALLMPGSVEMIASMYAAACIGAVIVPLNTYSKKDELKAYLLDSRPSLMIIGTGAHQLHYPSMMQEILTDCWMSGEDNSWLPFAIYVLGGEEDWLADGPLLPFKQLYGLSRTDGERAFAEACRAVRVSDPLIMLYTSGTVGTPKAVLRSTASFHAGSGAGRRQSKLTSALVRLGDRITRHFTVLNLLPLYHMGGFGTIVSLLKSCNIRLVMLGRFNPVDALAAVQKERCRIMIGTPYMIQRMLACPERSGYSLKSLIGVAFTSAAVSGAVLDSVTRELSLLFFLVSYGSSEAGAVANGTCFLGRGNKLTLRLLQRLMEHTNLLSGTIPYSEFRRNPYSLAGKVDSRVEVRIVDPQTGSPQPLREQGEIMIRSHRVMRYTKESKSRSSFTADGWYRSGDLGYLDDRGRLTITGRLHRLISRGGEKISPVEIEDKLLRHPDVEEAFVLGLSDALYGEQICACVVARRGSELTAEQLRSDLEPLLSAFKLPRYFVFLPDMPLSPTGKVAVADIRALALERLGASDTHA